MRGSQRFTFVPHLLRPPSQESFPFLGSPSFTPPSCVGIVFVSLDSAPVAHSLKQKTITCEGELPVGYSLNQNVDPTGKECVSLKIGGYKGKGDHEAGKSEPCPSQIPSRRASFREDRIAWFLCVLPLISPALQRFCLGQLKLEEEKSTKAHFDEKIELQMVVWGTSLDSWLEFKMLCIAYIFNAMLQFPSLL